MNKWMMVEASAAIGPELKQQADDTALMLQAGHVRKWSRPAQQALHVVNKCLQDVQGLESERTGFVIGANHTTLTPILALDADARQFGVQQTNPGLFPETVLNAIGGHLAQYFQFTGLNVTISNGSNTGLAIVQYAMDVLANQKLDHVIVVMFNQLPPAELQPYLHPIEMEQESVVALLMSRWNQDGSKPIASEQSIASQPISELYAVPDTCDLLHANELPWHLYELGRQYGRAVCCLANREMATDCVSVSNHDGHTPDSRQRLENVSEIRRYELEPALGDSHLLIWVPLSGRSEEKEVQDEHRT
ncbi:beta-ketoacyl synthase N-terminal-like domain-containing protein [Marinicrinis sediminis]|uniref:Beta-ketoacyl synthase N-terminal-like domain-containing protein n=1 Tax=Marinicrinis sediminis TaxID=1652465 RepID=A0ABW5RE08_9BACL